MLVEVALVAAEQFVAAHARKNDGHVLPRKLRNQEGRDERRVRDRFVHVPEQLRQQRGDVGLHDDLVVVRAEALRDLPGIRQLVVKLRTRGAVKADRVGLDGLRAVARHERHDGTRIDAAAQEGADRHVGHHLVLDGTLEPARTSSIHWLSVRPVVDGSRQAVEAVLANPAILDDQRRTRLELVHAHRRSNSARRHSRPTGTGPAQLESSRAWTPGTARMDFASDANISSDASWR